MVRKIDVRNVIIKEIGTIVINLESIRRNGEIKIQTI